MLKNLASSLFLTERDATHDDNAPKVKGRVVTTLQKAKEVRPLVEKCITLARRSLVHEENASAHATDASRNSAEWKEWRGGDDWQQWNRAIAPSVAARRHVLRLLGDKQAVSVLFDDIAPRFADREGGYTRVLRLAAPRLGDAGTRAILELVGVHDRVRQKSEKPVISDDEDAGEEISERNEPASASTTAGEDETAGDDES
jgi:large subunit ribosomal protein L17